MIKKPTKSKSAKKPKLADGGWIVVVHVDVPGAHSETYYVGVGTEREAKSKVRTLYDSIRMTAGRLSENSLRYLNLEVDEIRLA